MIKKLFFFLTISAFFFSCGDGSKTGNEKETTDETPVELTVTALLENADQYVNKPVIISGTVDHVCRHGGKKMFIFDENADSRIKITTGKNMPSFDVNLEGSEVFVEGIFQELIVDEQYIQNWEAEMKHEQHKEESEESGMHEQSVSKVQEAEHAEHQEQTTHGEEADQGEHTGDYEQIKKIKEELESSGKEHLSFYSVECVKYEINEKDK